MNVTILLTRVKLQTMAHSTDICPSWCSIFTETWEVLVLHGFFTDMSQVHIPCNFKAPSHFGLPLTNTAA